MEDDRYLDKYFENEAILLKIEYSEKRTMATFMNYLESLHSVADKLKNNFDCNIKDTPEFVILRVVRNYFHHVNDIKDYSMFVEFEEWGIYENKKHLIISIKDLAKSIKSFRDNTKDKKYFDKQIEIMSIFIENEILLRFDEFSTFPKFTVDDNNEVYEVGIDLFKYVYNISNIIADRCREIEELKSKKVICELEETYTSLYNIGKRDLFVMPSNVPILTTKGFVFPKNKSSIRRIE